MTTWSAPMPLRIAELAWRRTGAHPLDSTGGDVDPPGWDLGIEKALVGKRLRREHILDRLRVVGEMTSREYAIYAGQPVETIRRILTAMKCAGQVRSHKTMRQQQSVHLWMLP